MIEARHEQARIEWEQEREELGRREFNNGAIGASIVAVLLVSLSLIG